MIRVHRITVEKRGRSTCTNDPACACNPVALREEISVLGAGGEVTKQERMLYVHEPWRFGWDERVVGILKEREKNGVVGRN